MKSKKPLVGHNLLYDLLIMYHQFYQDLPRKFHIIIYLFNCIVLKIVFWMFSLIRAGIILQLHIPYKIIIIKFFILEEALSVKEALRANNSVLTQMCLGLLLNEYTRHLRVYSLGSAKHFLHFHHFIV